jgi:hypothetical protein
MSQKPFGWFLTCLAGAIHQSADVISNDGIFESVLYVGLCALLHPPFLSGIAVASMML